MGDIYLVICVSLYDNLLSEHIKLSYIRFNAYVLAIYVSGIFRIELAKTVPIANIIYNLKPIIARSANRFGNTGVMYLAS